MCVCVCVCVCVRERARARMSVCCVSECTSQSVCRMLVLCVARRVVTVMSQEVGFLKEKIGLLIQPTCNQEYLERQGLDGIAYSRV